MIPFPYVLRRRMMAQKGRNGPWTVTVQGRWMYSYVKTPKDYYGNMVTINGTSIPAGYGPDYATGVTQTFEVDDGAVITLQVGAKSDYLSNAYIEVDGVKIGRPTTEGDWYTYEYEVHSDCTVNGYRNGGSSSSNVNYGTITVTTT